MYPILKRHFIQDAVAQVMKPGCSTWIAVLVWCNTFCNVYAAYPTEDASEPVQFFSALFGTMETNDDTLTLKISRGKYPIINTRWPQSEIPDESFGAPLSQGMIKKSKS